jgi:ssDNA-binding Zn-finger/Zn-ribbon topoisomerase 1
VLWKNVSKWRERKMTGADNPDSIWKPSKIFKKWEKEKQRNKSKYNCPVCGKPLVHVRGWNEDIFGTDPKKNPFIGWTCENPDCKGWQCDNCDGAWHPYGTSCLGSRSRDWRLLRDPNWRHREQDLYENKYKDFLRFMRNRK